MATSVPFFLTKGSAYKVAFASAGERKTLRINAANTAWESYDTGDAANLVTGSLADGRLSANVPLLNAANVFTLAQSVRRDALGTTSTDGFLLENQTAAANNAQQSSPRLRFRGHGWKTNATAASQSVDMIAELLPVQGAAAPTGAVLFSSSINGGAYAPLLDLRADGRIGIYEIGTATPKGSIHFTGNSFKLSSGTSAMRFDVASTDSLLTLNSTSTFVGALLVAPTQSFLSQSFRVTPTWNNVATTYTAQVVNVTNTNSAADSLLANWQVGSVAKLQVNLGGSISLDSAAAFGWASGAAGTNDTQIFRGAAGRIEQRNSTNAQRFDLANTYTSDTSKEMLSLNWESNVAKIHTLKGSGGGSARSLEIGTDGTTAITIATNGDVTAAGYLKATTLSANITANALPFGGTVPLSIRTGGGNHVADFISDDAACHWRFLSSGSVVKYFGVSNNQYEFYGSSGGAPIAQITLSPDIGIRFGNADVELDRDAADALALRRSTNAQTFRVYNTYTSSTNYERGAMRWSSNVLRIGTGKGSGGGSARDLVLEVDETERLRISASTGHVSVGTLDSATALNANGSLNINDEIEVNATLIDTTPASIDPAEATWIRVFLGGVPGRMAWLPESI